MSTQRPALSGVFGDIAGYSECVRPIHYSTSDDTVMTAVFNPTTGSVVDGMRAEMSAPKPDCRDPSLMSAELGSK